HNSASPHSRVPLHAALAIIAIFEGDARENSSAARSRRLVSVVDQSSDDVRHLERRDGRLGALVSGLGAGALDGLLDAVRGESAEDDRHPARGRDLTAAAGDRARDVLEVRGGAANHAAERDDRAHFARAREPLAGHGYLERPRYPHDQNATLGDAVA